MSFKGLALVISVALIQLAGLYIFTRGFLLTRLSLPDINNCQTCTLPATHKRAVVLIIDALRFDFISPHPPAPTSPHHHNVLTLPHELTVKYPHNSVIFEAHADPPTTTLQRIKGLTTGSLPTFVDMGSNFGGSTITEDSLLKQLTNAGKRIAFMGDDTWLTAFPDSFQPNMTSPYDSFNVEDLHTVDEGVITHLFPLLEDESKPFDFLIGHFLGLDHVGHRFGPDHRAMRSKLEQMNDVLTRVVDVLDDETLLIVLGDHGMDETGDHGGDTYLETSCGVWIYSKGPPIISYVHTSPVAPRTTFHDATSGHRHIEQIDLVPTISILLGLPIPFNNLGTVIPEVLWQESNSSLLTRALELNAAQVKNYMDTYRASASGRELDDGWPSLQTFWQRIPSMHTAENKIIGLYEFNRFALSMCRAIWAQFDGLLMLIGLVLLGLGVLANWALFALCPEAKEAWNAWTNVYFRTVLYGLPVGVILGIASYFTLGRHLPGMNVLVCVLIGTSLVSSLVFISPFALNISLRDINFGTIPIILILHSLAFASNSYTVWEDRIVNFLLISSIVPFALVGFSAQNPHLRDRILGFTLLFAACVRLMAFSTICREEQQSRCHTTFFAGSGTPSPPIVVLVLVLPVAVALPYLIHRFLKISKSHHGLATMFLPWFLRSSLVGGSLYWLLEWAETEALFGDEWTPVLRTSRTTVARLAMGGIVIGGCTLWWISPSCLKTKVIRKARDGPSDKKQHAIIGYANAFGSPYLIFWAIFLALFFITTQSTGQVVLAFAVIAFLAYLEVLDSVRDVRSFGSASAASDPSAMPIVQELPSSPSPLNFSEVVPVALLAMHTFYRTGHQSTIPSIQWKTAFIVTPTVQYPFSPMTVILNFFGSFFLFALAAPLLGLWNRSPSLRANPRADSMRAGSAFMLYYACLLLGSAGSAAILRKHLMVWKIFAPRFMAAGAECLAVQLGVVVGLGVGVERITGWLEKVFSRLIEQRLIGKEA